jgi:hypothetical protein
MKKNLCCYLLLAGLLFFTFAACAPTAALQARNNLFSASQEADNQARMTARGAKGLQSDKLKMKGDIKKIKEAERLFDSRSGIVLTY